MIPDEVMVALPLVRPRLARHLDLHLRPEPPAPLPVPRYPDRTQPADRAPDWPGPPHLTGMDTRAFADLLAALEQYLPDHPPISGHRNRARHRILRRGSLSLSDRLLVTVPRPPLEAQIRALTWPARRTRGRCRRRPARDDPDPRGPSTDASATHPSPHPPQQTSPTSSAEPTPTRASNLSAARWRRICVSRTQAPVNRSIHSP
jgi:hypothetical protein